MDTLQIQYVGTPLDSEQQPVNQVNNAIQHACRIPRDPKVKAVEVGREEPSCKDLQSGLMWEYAEFG
jgi:hypothetical protein